MEIVRVENEIINNYEHMGFKGKLLTAGAQQVLNYTELGLKIIEGRIAKVADYKEVDILTIIQKIFFENLDVQHFTPNASIQRLKQTETLNYYRSFIEALHTYNLNTRINKLVAYWKKREDIINYQIYVGRSFGEKEYISSNYPDPRNKVYVNLIDHIADEKYLNNLAVIKLQIDEEYVGHEINLLVTTLLKFNIINQAEYDEFFYGTSDSTKIKILQLGLSRGIFNRLSSDEQIKNITFDKYGNAKANNDLEEYIELQKGIVKFELEQYFK